MQIKKYKMVIHYEAEIQGTDEENAVEFFWDRLDYGNRTPESLITDSMTLYEKKKCKNCGLEFEQAEGTMMSMCPECRKP